MQTLSKQQQKKPPSISVVIPTYNRAQVLVDTIEYLHRLSVSPKQIIVVDQTASHPNDIQEQLKNWHESELIEWIVLEHPSVVAAMNVGLQTADSDYVLFLDDDIKPIEGLLNSYTKKLIDKEYGIVAGRVIESWDDPEGDKSTDSFSFNSLEDGQAPFFMGGNVLVNRAIALELGGFDQNFKGTAHDYEREFSDRVLDAQHEIAYCGSAAIFHLKEESGGIRTYGHFLKTMKPHHAVGAYYYIFTSKRIKNKFVRIVQRLRQRVITRTHLKQPWWIPLTLVGDLLGIAWAGYLWASGPDLITIES